MTEHSDRQMSVQSRAAIEAFYDQLSDRTLSRYRTTGNARLDAAIEFIKRSVRNGQVVVDIGCGTGIVTEALAKHAPNARFIGVDISGANISDARDNVRLANVQFLHASVTEQAHEIETHLGDPVNVMCMVDVVEHLPADGRRNVFSQLAGFASKDCVLLMTYPSPEFQKHLITNDPQALQIIDNVIEIGALMAEARVAGWKLQSFRYVDVWSTNQYVHATFVRELPLMPVQAAQKPLLRRGISYITRKLFR